MPGKVNPVIPEATLQVCAQVIGNDAAITVAGASGSFELNVMLPVIARNLLESMRLLATLAGCSPSAASTASPPTPTGCARYAESSPCIVTPLNKYVGYEAAAKIAKQALADRRHHPRRPCSTSATSSAASSPRSSSTRPSTWTRMTHP